MNKFKWGHGFISLNRDVLESYMACKTGQEVLDTQHRWLTEGGPKASLREMPDDDDHHDAGSRSEGSEETDDDLPPLEPNRNKSHHRIGGGSRAASFPRGMPPSESESETESEDEEGDATAEVSRGLANASIE